MRRRVEHDPLAHVGRNGLRGQHERMVSIDLMPTRLAHVGDALAYGDAVEVFGKLPLMRAVNPQPVASKLRAEPRGVSLERGVRDMARVLATVSVAKSYQLAPSAPVRIATPAEDLEGRRDPN